MIISTIAPGGDQNDFSSLRHIGFASASIARFRFSRIAAMRQRVPRRWHERYVCFSS
jgi:hypothetical protein